MEDPDDCRFMTIAMPGDLDPFDRHYGLTVQLDAELRLEGLGCSSGGGTLYIESQGDHAEPEICFSIVDIDATDVEGARALLRLHLPELGAPPGTLVQWDEQEDRFDGERWHLNEPRTLDHLDL